MPELRPVRAKEFRICDNCKKKARYYHLGTAKVRVGPLTHDSSFLICDNCASDGELPEVHIAPRGVTVFTYDTTVNEYIALDS